jgi:hypothetical protein
LLPRYKHYLVLKLEHSILFIIFFPNKFHPLWCFHLQFLHRMNNCQMDWNTIIYTQVKILYLNALYIVTHKRSLASMTNFSLTCQSKKAKTERCTIFLKIKYNYRNKEKVNVYKKFCFCQIYLKNVFLPHSTLWMFGQMLLLFHIPLVAAAVDVAAVGCAKCQCCGWSREWQCRCGTFACC